MSSAFLKKCFVSLSAASSQQVQIPQIYFCRSKGEGDGMKGLLFFFSELETRSLESDTNKIYHSANESEQDLK